MPFSGWINVVDTKVMEKINTRLDRYIHQIRYVFVDLEVHVVASYFFLLKKNKKYINVKIKGYVLTIFRYAVPTYVYDIHL